MAGSLLTEEFELVSDAADSYAGRTQAVVAAKHEGKSYLIYLTQPVKTGDGGIWAISMVTED